MLNDTTLNRSSPVQKQVSHYVYHVVNNSHILGGLRKEIFADFLWV